MSRLLVGIGLLALGALVWAAPVRQFTLAWTVGAGLPADVYRLERRPNPGMWGLLTYIDGADDTYTDPAPLRGTTCYRLRAEAGTEVGAWSNTVCGKCKRCR